MRRLSEYGSVACLVARPTRETQAEQYSDTVLRKGPNGLRVLSATFILSKNSRVLDAKSRQTSANLGKNRLISAKIG